VVLRGAASRCVARLLVALRGAPSRRHLSVLATVGSLMGVGVAANWQLSVLATVGSLMGVGVAANRHLSVVATVGSSLPPAGDRRGRLHAQLIVSDGVDRRGKLPSVVRTDRWRQLGA
jgi:hypothetical protein